MTLSANDQMKSLDDYRQLIGLQNGAPVRLGDIATIVQGAENAYLGAWANNEQAIVINVQRQPGANVIETTDTIRTLLPELIESLPKSVNVDILTDRTSTIRASVNDVQFELMLAIALVVMVIYLFLRNGIATLIPGIAVPLSLVGTFAVMYFCGFSVNNLTLMALTIATGFVVDDAIVVIENISRYLEKAISLWSLHSKGRVKSGLPLSPSPFFSCSVNPAVIYGGYCRPVIPRICHYPSRGYFDLRCRLFDVNANDVCAFIKTRVAT